jgi:DNA polymerase-4
MRTLLHVDMDAFFAAVELLRHPELRGKPVVVGGKGDPTQRGVVSTASYEARQYGIYSGMPLRTAYKRCPEAVFLPVDHATYAKVSRKIKAILYEFSPRVEEIGLDEAFLDVSGSASPPAQIAHAIKERIKTQTGLTSSVGIGPNKLLAKIASDLQKPDGLTHLAYEDIPHRVWPLPVRKIWGVGPKSEARLAQLDVTTIGDLAALPLDTLVKIFGQAHGHYLYRAARGIDESPVVTHRKRKSIGRETTFQHDIVDWNTLIGVVGKLSQTVVGRLRQYHYKAHTVTVKLRFADFETHTRSLTLPDPTDQLSTIKGTARKCLHRIVLTKPVRLVGIRLSHLETHTTRHKEASL